MNKKNDKEYMMLGQYLAVKEKNHNLFDYLYQKGIDKILLYDNTDITQILTSYLGELKQNFSIVTRNGQRIQTIVFGSYQSLMLKDILQSSHTPDEAFVITGDDISANELRLLKTVFNERVYFIEELIKHAIRDSAFYQPLKNYLLQNNLRVSVFYIPPFDISAVKKPSKYESLLGKENSILTSEDIEKIKKTRREIVYKEYSDEQIKEIGKMEDYYMHDGVVLLQDYSSDWVNIRSGYRNTTDSPQQSTRNIWFFGNSRSKGQGVIDSDTIQSNLQRILNESAYSGVFSIFNCPRGGSYTSASYFPYISSLPIKYGDILVFMLTHVFYGEFERIQIEHCLQRPHDKHEIFIDKHHLNGTGNNMLAQTIFEYLDTSGYLKQIKTNYPHSLTSENNENSTSQLDDYIQSIVPLRIENGISGSIVVNCNPFTLGHRFLIEYAANKVDRLFLFVVEEDKSEFTFADRFRLVKKGIAGIENVVVIPSGKYIISTKTFAEYFEKSEKQDITIDATQDLKIFGSKIAPALGITKRFAGEEPFDNITRQYNDSMQRILPQYGIEFEVIPRKENDGEAISASRVRELLRNRDFDAIAQLVPKSTLQFLIEEY